MEKESRNLNERGEGLEEEKKEGLLQLKYNPKNKQNRRTIKMEKKRKEMPLCALKLIENHRNLSNILAMDNHAVQWNWLEWYRNQHRHVACSLFTWIMT